MRKEKLLLLTDLDGTLRKSSLIYDHAIWLKNLGWNFLEVIEEWKYSRNDDLLNFTCLQYKNNIVGKTVEELMLEDFLEEVVKDFSLSETVFHRMRVHTMAEKRVLIVSGSPDFLVRRFADKISKKFEIDCSGIGSFYEDVDGYFTGNLTDNFSSKGKKLTLETLIDLEKYDIIESFGDTVSDSPLFEVANKSFLIDPNANTFQYFDSRYMLVKEPRLTEECYSFYPNRRKN